MKFRITELRRIIKLLIIESMKEEDVQDEVDLPYEETLMPDEEGKGVIGGPDFSEQPARDDYLEKKADTKVKKKKDKLRSQEETEADVDETHAIVGHIGPMGTTGYGPGDKPFGKQAVLKPKNAMGPKSIKEALLGVHK